MFEHNDSIISRPAGPNVPQYRKQPILLPSCLPDHRSWGWLFWFGPGAGKPPTGCAKDASELTRLNIKEEFHRWRHESVLRVGHICCWIVTSISILCLLTEKRQTVTFWRLLIEEDNSHNANQRSLPKGRNITANQCSLPKGRNITANQQRSLPKGRNITANQRSHPKGRNITTNQRSLPAVQSELQQEEMWLLLFADSQSSTSK